MPLYNYPQIMYRSDGATFTCNSDQDVANLVTPQGTSWASMPWAPASYTTVGAQTDYTSILAANALPQTEVAALQAQIASADATLTSSGL